MHFTDSMLITIQKPDVYRLPDIDSYIFFGVPCAQEPDQQAQEMVAQSFKIQDFLQQALGNDESTTDDSDLKNQLPFQVCNADVQLVMSQGNVSRKKAIRTLVDYNNDFLNAILALTV